MEQRRGPGAGQEKHAWLEASHASSQAIDPGALEAAESDEARARERATRPPADDAAGGAPEDTFVRGGPTEGASDGLPRASRAAEPGPGEEG